MKTKEIYRLPELKDSEEWKCDGGCSTVRPMLHKHAFRQSWDAAGNLIDQQNECYYTCQQGHVLGVWDTTSGDDVELPEEHYTEHENTYNWDLETVKQARKLIQDFKLKYCGNSFLAPDDFSGAIEATLSNGEKIRFTEHYINEMEALLTGPNNSLSVT